MLIEKIQHNEPKMPELVMSALLKAMESGTLNVGDTLPSERDLSELLGVGRGSLREALAVLEFLGVISSNGNRKIIRRDACHVRNSMAFVRLGNDPATLEDFLEFRLYNETQIVRLACDVATNKDIKRMEESLKRLKLNNQDNLAHRDFHQNLALSAHNIIFAVVMDMVNTMMIELRQRNSAKAGYMPSTVDDHEEVLEAIRAKDKERAERAIANHLKNIAEFCDLDK